MSDGTLLGVGFELEGRPWESETHFIRFSPYVLSVRTVLPQYPFCAELHSVFTGHRRIATRATHLLLGPLGHEPSHITRDHLREGVDPIGDPASCVLEHLGQVIEIISAPGRMLSISWIDEQALDALGLLPH